jgi:ankyrin repeat protein
MSQQITQEEYDIIIEDARYGDLETLQEIFAELPSTLLLEIKEADTLNTPIHMASANGHLAVVEYLLSLLPLEEAKQLVNLANIEGNTALHWASLNGHLSVVELLCDKYEADAFVKNKFGHDAIYEAENNGKELIETYFLKKFDVEPLDEDGSVDVKVTNAQVEVKQGEEIEKITQEQVDQMESNEKFLEERTKQNMDI